MCVGVTLWYGCSGVVSVCRLKPDQCNPCNNSTHKSQAPEDGCINIRNMLSIKYRNKASGNKLVSLYSTIKMMHGPINVRFCIMFKMYVLLYKYCHQNHNTRQSTPQQNAVVVHFISGPFGSLRSCQ